MFEFFEKMSVFDNIIFNEDIHKYTIDGKSTTSVTQLIHTLEEFDAELQSERTANKRRLAGETDCTAQKVLAEWKQKALISTEKGTLVHKYIENYLSHKIEKYPKNHMLDVFNKKDPIEANYKKIIPMVNKFYKDMLGKMIPLKSEFIVGDNEFLLCGMIDQLFYNKKSKKIEIWDWKTNTEFTLTSKYKLLYPLDYISNSKLDVYSLQLSLYKYIIMKNTGLELGDSFIAWFSENNDSYRVLKCHDYQKEIKILLEQHNKSRKANAK